MKATTTRRILKKVASLLGKEEKLSSPIKEVPVGWPALHDKLTYS
jgi:hypothetical protein